MHNMFFMFYHYKISSIPEKKNNFLDILIFYAIKTPNSLKVFTWFFWSAINSFTNVWQIGTNYLSFYQNQNSISKLQYHITVKFIYGFISLCLMQPFFQAKMFLNIFSACIPTHDIIIPSFNACSISHALLAKALFQGVPYGRTHLVTVVTLRRPLIFFDEI